MAIGSRSGSVENIIVSVQTKGFEKLVSTMKSIGPSFHKAGRQAKQTSIEMGRMLHERGQSNLAIQRANKAQQSLNKLMSGSAQGLIKNASNINALGKQYDSFGGVMSMPMEQFQKFNKGMGEFDSKGAQRANKLRMMTHGLKGFRMEMLGVMFFGMAMQRMFTGLLQPALQATGIFEIWSAVLTILFLPIILELLPLFLEISNFLMNLPDSTKLAIGVLALLGIAFSSLLMVVGQLALGLGSLIQLTGFMKAGTGLANFLTSAKGVGSFLGKGIVLAVGVYLTYKWLKSTANILSDFKTSWDARVKNLLLATFAGAALGFVVGGPAGAIIGAKIGFSLSIGVNIADIFLENYELMKKKMPFLELLSPFSDSISKIKDIIEMKDMIDSSQSNSAQSIINQPLLDSFRYSGSEVLQATKLNNNFIRKDYEETVQGFSETIVSYGGGLSDFIGDTREIIVTDLDFMGDSFIGFGEEVERVLKGISSGIEGLYNEEKFGNIMSGKLGATGGGTAFGGSEVYNDFISRPGGGISTFSPDDTVFGVKDTSMIGGKSVVINQSNNISGSNNEEIERAIKENNSNLVDEIKRMVGA